MEHSNAHIEWSHLGDRWRDFARRVHVQWPEIELGVILATLGHRDRLVDAVAETYGLDRIEADRAVSIWDASVADERNRSKPPATPSVA